MAAPARDGDGALPLGNRVVLHAGCVVGSEGFGWAFVEGRLERIPQVGNVVLDDDVEIGANSCVDRAQTGSTHIGDGTKIDNLVQIGHNCRIGKHCALASLTGLAGSTVVGDYVKIAGQVGTRGHMTIGSRSTVAGQSGVWGDVAEGVDRFGKSGARTSRRAAARGHDSQAAKARCSCRRTGARTSSRNRIVRGRVK